MAKLVIYNSIADEKPSKEFICRRTTMLINNKLEELTDEVNLLDKEVKEQMALITDKTSDKEANEIKARVKDIEEQMNVKTLEIIRLFFPDFTDEDYLKLDPYDYQTFILEIGEMRNNIYNRAAKN